MFNAHPDEDTVFLILVLKPVLGTPHACVGTNECGVYACPGQQFSKGEIVTKSKVSRMMFYLCFLLASMYLSLDAVYFI